MRLLFATLLAAGCYNPSVPTGGYRCSAVDNACPSTQHCSCGLCVNNDNEAACSFSVDIGAAPLTVKEHQQFPVTITAKAAGGGTASGFNDTVSLSFTLPDGTRWGDVRPSTVALKGGTAQLNVTVNRESIPPQSPQLTASFAGNGGSSAGITVLARTFKRDATALANAPFGWAMVNASSPSVVWDGKQFRMYFAGNADMMSSGVGVALSSDGGKSFQPQPSKLFPASGSVFNKLIISAGAYQNGGWSLAVAGIDPMSTTTGSTTGDIVLATSQDGLSTFALANGGNAIVTRQACPFCDYTVWFPSLMRGLAPAGVDGGTGDWLMFFAAAHCLRATGCMTLDGTSMAIGRAHSSDGVMFTAEPAPVLSGEQGGEAYLAAPVVMLDGGVYKMWYAFTRSLTAGDACGSHIQTGYATSTDGFYWVRSPSNPVLDNADKAGWDGSAPGLLTTAVVPTDGQDPESGLQAYYSSFYRFPILNFCALSNIGRAVAE
jgi:hypothetical protein